MKAKSIPVRYSIVTTLKEGERMLSPFKYPTLKQAELAATRCHPDVKAEVIYVYPQKFWRDYK